jgi:TonB-dependent SusC/RagA subfamily outer membrane receptor
MRKIASLFMMLMVLCTLAFAQSRTVSGTVRDQNGNPVPFATITQLGTQNATTADANGNFSFSVPENAQLAISATGFQAQTLAASANLQSITLARGAGELQEVVVTALGLTRSKNQLPYAAQKIQGSEVNQSRSSNFIGNLSGRVAGLDIRQNNTMGGSTNVLLRGAKSLTGNNQALFVVDGVPFDNGNNNTLDQTEGRGGYDYGNAAADINPDDIESITVLKGAAASALYGSRGSNGVILINTKKGRRGFNVTVNSGITRGSILGNTFPEYQKRYGGGYGSYFDSEDIDGDGTPDDIALGNRF